MELGEHRPPASLSVPSLTLPSLSVPSHPPSFQPMPDNFYLQNVIAHFFQDLPKAGSKRPTESFNLKTILNEKLSAHYITYAGSLTSPPCTEGVQWFVLGRPWNVPKGWVKSFKHAMPQPNIRPLQELGEKSI